MSASGGGGAAAAGPPQHPPSAPPGRENLVQRNIRLKVCAYCKTPGAQLKCETCLQRTYCNKKCQKKDWKAVHRGQCKKLQQVFVPPKAGWREAAAAGDGAAASGGAAVTADDDGIENPCPVCLDNEDDAFVDGEESGMCSACGQMYCGACKAGGLADRSPNCPTCRAPLIVSHEEDFKRTWKLVHDRSPGRYTPEAQFNLGNRYDNGEGVKQDYTEARKWYRCAADQGHAGAQYNLGLMYRQGTGVEQDDKEAVKLYRLAAEQGNATAQSNLGYMYDHGNGVEQDYIEAVKLYQLAAEQGNAGAQFNLGNMYHAGRGVKQNDTEAVKWYRSAAKQGDAVAQYNLGAKYYNGKGVPANDAEAVKWFQLAAVQGHEDAIHNLDIVQQRNDIPTPPPGTTITTVLLTSAKTAKLNNKTGVVVAAPSPAMVRPGIAFVLLDGEDQPKMLKLMNLRV